MIKVGFIDYYLSEWHANNYPAWIKDAAAAIGEDFEVKYAWAELDVSPLDGVSSEEWCEKNGATLCHSIDELCSSADYILILAPSNPEKHLAYAKEALKCGKNTYIDKTFAPDYETAKEIFDISEKYGTKFFSSSALRYATELDAIVDAVSVITTGGGSNIDEYIIHQAEIAVKLIDDEPVGVMVEAHGANQRVCNVKFANGASAKLIYAPGYGFSVNADTKCGSNLNKGISSDFFAALISDILRFYLTGEVSFNTKQTLSVMKIRGAIVNAKNSPNVWVEL